MNYQDYRTLTLNGQRLKEHELLAYCFDSSEEYMHDIGSFLKEWLDDKTTLTIKTSGSTGEAKQISVEKNQMLGSAALTAAYFKFEKGQTALLALPISYIAGKMMVVRALYSGLNLLCQKPNTNPVSLLSNVAVIDFAPFTPMQMYKVKDTKNIRKILLGGAPLTQEAEEKMQVLKAGIFLGYGMTETLSHVALRRINGENRSEVYRVLEGISIRTDDRDCLIVKAPFLPKPVFTNDVVEIKSKRTFVWKGRTDYVVNSGGIKLFPEEIEKKVASFIFDRFFFAGLPDEKLGQKLCLFIERETYSDSEKADLIKKIAQVVEVYEKPREIYTVSEFKTTSSGKIRRDESIKNISTEL